MFISSSIKSETPLQTRCLIAHWLVVASWVAFQSRDVCAVLTERYSQADKLAIRSIHIRCSRGVSSFKQFYLRKIGWNEILIWKFLSVRRQISIRKVGNFLACSCGQFVVCKIRDGVRCRKSRITLSIIYRELHSARWLQRIIVRELQQRQHSDSLANLHDDTKWSQAGLHCGIRWM